MSKRAKRKNCPLNNLVVVSDLHIGCQVALCHPDGARMDNGGIYKPNEIQLAIWKWWREFWDDWVPIVAHGEPWVLCVNGDTIDGVHHGSTTQWSQNLEDQERHAIEILEPIVKKSAAFYLIRGTEAHVGKSGDREESIAQRLGAIPSTGGKYARDELWKQIGDRGLAHIMHHVGTTSSAQHEASAVNAELTREYQESARWGERAPDFVVRSHRHNCISVEIPCARGMATSVVTPGWQAKTPFAYRSAGSRCAQPQFGGIFIRCGNEDAYCRQWVRHPARDKIE